MAFSNKKTKTRNGAEGGFLLIVQPIGTTNQDICPTVYYVQYTLSLHIDYKYLVY